MLVLGKRDLHDLLVDPGVEGHGGRRAGQPLAPEDLKAPLVEGRGDLQEYRNPYVQWRTKDASPSGLAYLDGSLWAGALRGGVRLGRGKRGQPDERVERSSEQGARVERPSAHGQ